MAENIITQKVGPLPLVVWVAGGSGVILLFIMLTHKGSSGSSANQTNQVSALAPTEAEAFGTIEQQQQDVTNALTTLGNNQAALGGSVNTLTTSVDDYQNYSSTQFGNILSGIAQNWQGIQGVSGQVAGVSGQVSGIQSSVDIGNQNAANYYNSLLSNMTNYYQSLTGQLGTVNGNILDDKSAQAAGFANLDDYLSKNDARVGTLVDWIDEIKARLQNGDYSAPRWGASNQPWTAAASPKPA